MLSSVSGAAWERKWPMVVGLPIGILAWLSVVMMWQQCWMTWCPNASEGAVRCLQLHFWSPHLRAQGPGVAAWR